MENKYQNILKKALVVFAFLFFSGFIGCAPEDNSGTDKTSSLVFKLELENAGNVNSRQSINDLPECAEATPAYAKVVLTGPENVGSLSSPAQVAFSSDTETEALSLPAGEYQLEYMAVYDDTDEMIWIAPTESSLNEYVQNPLPATVNLSTHNYSSLPVEVICFENRVLTDPNAITAAEYVSELGVGFDVTWSEFRKYMNLYSAQVPADFAEAGFTNVRIRMNEENPDAEFMADLKEQIQHCLDNGIKPIIAYQGHYLEETATSDEEARTHLVNWWRNMAEELKDFPFELSFNILVEISGRYKTDYTAMNSFYADVYDAIRESNPNRILIFPPVKISKPEYLQYLEIPGGDDPFLMAEWHLYAAGPKKSPSKKYWIDGSTAEERENVTGPIETAVQWMNDTGHVTWVGAWMAGNYNKGNEYTVEEQADFATFMSRQLNKYDIPYSLNAGNKYYDYETNTWFNRTNNVAGIPVRDAILDPDKISLYSEVEYSGSGTRLAVGEYNAADLQSLGFYENIKSLMVPFDFEVTVYSGDNLAGTSQVLDITTRDLSGFSVKSLEVTYLNSY